MLRIDVCAMQQFETGHEPLELRQQIQQRKQAVYAFRNQLLSQLSGQVIGPHSFACSDYGKPYLKTHPLAFNHSHSKQLYALVSSPKQQDIGIDVEDLDRNVRFDALARHAFHPTEYQTWQALEQDRRYWFKVWTAKEAILKASGLGIRLNLRDLNTEMHPEQTYGQMQHEQLGHFAYQSFEVAQSLLTVAWRSGQGCAAFILPRIQIYRH